MRSSASKPKGNDVIFTIADFYEAGCERLQLEVLAGNTWFDREIAEPMVSRPGLALTGFYEHFDWKRIQLIGKAETAYLKSLGPDVAEERFLELIKRKAFCFVFTNGQKPTASFLRIAEKHGVVILASPMKTRFFSYHSAFILATLSAPRTSLYATMVEVCGIGVLFEGDPGLGKSETALGLIKKGHALVADDLTCIRKDVANNLIYGSASEATGGFMEIRGIGIMNVTKVFGINSVRGEKRIQLVITFKRLKDIEGEVDRVGATRRFKSILGVNIPHVVIPVSEGRDLVNLVETAVQQQKLINTGYDPVEALSDRLKIRADKNEKISQSRKTNQMKGR